MIFLSLPPIAKYNVSRSIKQKIAPATSGGVSQETCTHLTCKYMINATSCCIITFHLKRELQKNTKDLRSSETVVQPIQYITQFGVN